MPRIPRPNSDRRSHHKQPAPMRAPQGTKGPLGDLPAGDWHQATRRWWEEVRAFWASPLGGEFAPVDVCGLERLAVLIDGFSRAETAREKALLAGEIRIASACFGLDPVSRRRLGWRLDPLLDGPETLSALWMRPRSA